MNIWVEQPYLGVIHAIWPVFQNFMIVKTDGWWCLWLEGSSSWLFTIATILLPLAGKLGSLHLGQQGSLLTPSQQLQLKTFRDEALHWELILILRAYHMKLNPRRYLKIVTQVKWINTKGLIDFKANLICWWSRLQYQNDNP